MVKDHTFPVFFNPSLSSRGDTISGTRGLTRGGISGRTMAGTSGGPHVVLKWSFMDSSGQEVVSKRALSGSQWPPGPNW